MNKQKKALSVQNSDSAFFYPDKNTIPIGRFAPSPTGPLHFGSLIAATASYLNIKTKNNGKWLLRIEDVDTGRIQKGATKSIIQSLEAYGFEWDGDIIYQSQRSRFYKDALDSINSLTYPCSCTRKSLISSSENYSYIYPENCRTGLSNPNASNLSIRILTHESPLGFFDLCQCKYFEQNINKTVGDFILKRSDGLWAYQLAVVVDDALQGITEVIRGADLFDNTPRQIYLQQRLGYPTPDYLHFPVITDNNGKKLSKQNKAKALSNSRQRETLVSALSFLGQKPPKADAFSSLDDLWAWSFDHWDHKNIPKIMSQPYPLP